MTVVEQRTDSTEKLCGNEVSLLLPSEVFIVESIILVQEVEILGQVGRAVETVNMDEGFGRSHGRVVLD